MKRENILRWIVLGQLLMVFVIALIATPANGTYLEAILQSVILFALFDIVGLGIAYIFRYYEFYSFFNFINRVW